MVGLLTFFDRASWETNGCGIAEKEIEIVYDLAQRVLRYENVLVDASDVCGELDR